MKTGIKSTLTFLALSGLALLSGFSNGGSQTAWETLGEIPVQNGGRIKPFETFAQETLLTVAGKRELGGEEAVRVVWKWISDPEEWFTKSFLRVRHPALREEFGLRVINGRVSPENVLSHQPFEEEVERAFEKQEKKEPMTSAEKKRIELYDQARLFRAVAQGAVPGLIPDPEDPRQAWFPIDALVSLRGRAALEKYYASDFLAGVHTGLAHLVGAIHDGSDLSGPAREFSHALEALAASRDIILDRTKIKIELFYNDLRPFHWGWILYLVSALLWLLRGAAAGDGETGSGLRLLCRSIGLLAMTLWVTAFLLHTLGFILRCWVAGRPPVSNMYESIIWVGWGAVLFSVFLAWIHKNRTLIAAASWVAFLTLLIGESFPTVLDPSLSPLVPVLRSNYWLTIHVLTITLSYGAFALAWGLAHVTLFHLAFHPHKKHPSQDEFLYRSLQIGVVLLAAGTILGGVWANESWGRFWGWDPKETWALIALLFYLAVLHCRFVGWIGPFGTAVGALLSFLGILMAWYGVNFVLAAGLHSYGFGGGGFPYVSLAVLADLALVSFFAFRYHRTHPAR